MAGGQNWCRVLTRGEDNDVVRWQLGMVGTGDEVGGKVTSTSFDYYDSL
jgi:hypothetical protein